MITLLRRFAFYLIAAFAAITLNFLLPRMLPGDALQNVLASIKTSSISPAELAALSAQYGMNSHQGLLPQYFTYVGHLFTGNLGTSTGEAVSVTSILLSDLPWTLGLVGSATIIAFILGTLIGIMAGWRRGGILDSLLPVATFFQSVPYFILAFLLLLTAGYTWKWFPLGEGYDTGRRANPLIAGWNEPFITSVLQHAVLPVSTIVLASIAGWIIGMRNMMVTTMDEDYVLVAAAKGLPRWQVIKVAARNAILPSISNFSLSISLVVTGSIITEIVFSYPGIGFQTFNAIQATDYPLLQGILLCVTFTVLAANFLADIVYVILDPRARREG